MTNRNKQTLPWLAGLIAIAAASGGLGLMHYPGISPLSDRAVEASTSEKDQPEILLSTSRELAPSGLYNYGGSTTMVPIRQMMEPYIQKTRLGFQLRYTNPVGQAPGSGSGIKMLLDGQLAFSESSRPLKPEEYDAAKQRGFELEQIAVAIDGIAIAVNPHLAIEGISIQQLSDIYQGRITNWSEVGGPNLEIQPFSRSPEAGGTPEFFVENVLDANPLDKSVAIVVDTTTGLRKVAMSPGGIYYASAPEVVPQCIVQTLPLAKTDGDPFVSPFLPPLVNSTNCPEQRNQLNAAAFRAGTYPLTRQLFVVVKKNGAAEEEAGQAYADILLSPEGQALIEEAGFISIR
ncbi:MAG: PstS family phosphate ABC transporter substrate-binding protein [Cyanobacteria bacterium J06626_18]